MRIGTVVVDLLDVKRVGSERRYGELLRRLERRGCELHLFARRWDEAAARNIICHRVSVPGPAAMSPLLFAVSAFLDAIPDQGRDVRPPKLADGANACRRGDVDLGQLVADHVDADEQ